MRKLTKQEKKHIADSFEAEYNRLLNTGAISEKTTMHTVIRVALENMSDSYSIGNNGDYQNLRKF